MAVENEGKTKTLSPSTPPKATQTQIIAATALAATATQPAPTKIPNAGMLGINKNISHNNDTNNITTAQIVSSPTSSTSTSSSASSGIAMQQDQHQQQHKHKQSSLINGNCSGNSLNNNNNHVTNNNNSINNTSIIGCVAATAAGIIGINSANNNNNNNIGISTKSETSSNASVNGSIKKTSSSSNTTLINSSSREDITSIGGNSSINSHSTSNNNTNHIKGPKDNIHTHFYNGPPPGRHHPHNIMSEGDGLGPLPQKWEKAFTENGELYFIDHNTGTSHWLDPRLSKFQKKSLEDCMDDELPYGWEKIDDPQYGTYFIDHVNRRTQYENPVLEAKRRVERNRNGGGPQEQQQQQQNQQLKPPPLPYTFTRNPAEMRGERITTTLLKSSRGLGITIVGGDDNVEEFLQIKSIVPNGPAWLDGKLQTGDILVYVNDTCVLGFTHHEMVNVFQSILPGETVTLEVCRGYPLPFDPNDPNTEVVTTIAVDGISSDPQKSRILMDLNMDGNYNFLDLSDSAGAVGGQLPPTVQLQQQNNPLAKIQSGLANGGEINENYIGNDRIVSKQPEILQIDIVKGIMGFGFTIADSVYGQKVKKILDRNCCKNLQEGDILLEINSTSVKHMSHSEVVQVLKDCPKTKDTTVRVQRGHYNDTNSRISNGGTTSKLRKSKEFGSGSKNPIAGMFRSKTPTADLYSTQQKEILPIRPKTPLVDTRRARAKTPSNELNEEVEAATSGLLDKSTNGEKMQLPETKSNNSLHEIDSINNDIPFMDPFPKLVTTLTERLAEASMINDNHSNLYQHPMDMNQLAASRLGAGPYDTHSIGQDYTSTYSGPYGTSKGSTRGEGGTDSSNGGLYSPPPPMPIMAPVPTYHHEACFCYECQDYNRYQLDYQNQAMQLHHQQQQQIPTTHPIGYGQHSLPHHNGRMHHQKRVNDFLIDRRKSGFSPLETHLQQQQQAMSSQHHSDYPVQFGQPALWKYELSAPHSQNLLHPPGEDEYTLSEVVLDRQALGFGFRIVGGTEEGSQVTVGHIVPGGAADGDPRIATGDEILSIDGVNVVSSSHHKVVGLMGEAAHRGHVTMILRRRVVLQHHRISHNPNVMPMRSIQYPYDVIVSRHENEGFGFVIISSSNQFYGSTIGKLIPGSPADRCGDLKVGDRIIAVNRIEIAGMSHGEVVNLIKESGLHVRLTIGCPQEGRPNVNGGIIGIAGNPMEEQSPIIAALKADHHHQQQQQQQQQQQRQLNIAGSYFDQRSQHPQL